MGSESQNKVHGTEVGRTQYERVGSAFFYGVSSLAVIFVNKIILSEYQFPSFIFLAGAQFFSTSIILYTLSQMRKIELPSISRAVLREVAPISIMFFLNVVSGLGSTKSLNLPMFTALRRFSIFMTMAGEYYILGKEPTGAVVLSVAMMVGGAIVAAVNDLTFDPHGYALVLMNDVFTALSGIYLKRAMLSDRFSKLGILFYNSLLSGFFVALIFFVDYVQDWAYLPVSIHQKSMIAQVLAFDMWDSAWFTTLFVLATFLGTILNYATFLCTSINSPLTTTVVGCLKNVLTTYVGMFFMTGYHYTTLNSLGLNISIFGSLYYTYVNIFNGSKGLGEGPEKGSSPLLPTSKQSSGGLP
jgi:solute carrier family 35